MKVVKKLLSALLVLAMLFVTPLTTGLANAAADGDKTEPPVTGTKVTKLDLEDLDPETLHHGTAGAEKSDRRVISAEPEEIDPDKIVRVSIFLEDKSTFERGFAMKGVAGNKQAVNYRRTLETKQKSVQSMIEKKIGHALNVQWNLTLLVNAISVEIPYKDIETIKTIPGVKSVEFENIYYAHEAADEPNTANTSSGMVGATVAWSEGYTGAGSKIAILDTGIDVTHQSFNPDAYKVAIMDVIETYHKKIYVMGKIDNDLLSQLNAKKKMPSLTANDLYVNAKIPFAFNYSQGSLDVSHNDNASNHGSHVAGIAAANRYVIIDNQMTDAASSVYAVGMAPDAQLIVMDVFKSNGGASDSDYFAAIEDAILLGCDSANLSLGSPSQGFTYSNGYQDVLNRLVSDQNIDMVVAISAGNEGAQTDNLQTDLYIEDVSLHTGGSPGSFINSMCVASADNIGFTDCAIEVGDIRFSYWETDYKNEPLSTIAGEHEFVYIDALGNADEYAEVNEVVPLEGKVVIVNRGSLNFSVKGNNLISYNPAALLIANNEPGQINMDLSAFNGTFPMVSFAFEAANAIKEVATSGQTEHYTYYTGTMLIPAEGEYSTGITGTRENATVSSFSSWGVPGSLIMKPEITAPGGNIWSVNGTSTASSDSGTGPDKYIAYSGTSMAAPHIAGLAAVVAEYLRENEIENRELTAKYGVRAINQSLIMSTATPMMKDGLFISILQQGAGLVEVSKAINASSVIMMDDAYLTTATKAAADGKVKVELGDDPERTGEYTYTFTIYNIKDVDLEFVFDTKMFTQDYYHLTYADNQFDIDNDFMDQATIEVDAVTSYYYDGADGRHDVNKDGVTGQADAQAILDYLTGTTDASKLNIAAGDMDGDGKVTSYDAELLLHYEPQTALVVPANGSAQVTVKIELNDTFDDYPNGAYIEGFTYVTCVTSDEEGVDYTHEHTIPILGFYGNWTDPSMFDCITDNEYVYGLSNKIPYSAAFDQNGRMTASNTSGYTSFIINGQEVPTFYCNPYSMDDDGNFREDYLAVNTKAKVGKIYYNLIRSAGTGGYALSKVDGYGGDVIEVLSSKIKNVDEEGMFFYASQGEWWYNDPRTCSINQPLDSLGLEEGDTLRIAYYALPELTAMKLADDMTEGNAGILTDNKTFADLIESNTLGKGAECGYDFVIDNTAPVVEEATLDEETGIMTVKVSDNNRIAYVGLLSVDGSVGYVEIYPGEKEATIEIDASNAIENAKTYVAILVGDYAMNESAVAAKVNDIDYEIKYIFVPAEEFKDGEIYQIVDTDQPGAAYCQNISSRYMLSAKSITIKEGDELSGNRPYFFPDGVSNWTNSQNRLKAYSRYLKLNNAKTGLTTNATDSDNVWNWDGEKHQLYLEVGGTKYYVYYNNGFKVTTEEKSVYLFQRVSYKVPIDVDPYKVTDLWTEPEELRMFVGQTGKINTYVLPLTASPEVTFESLDPEVMTVDENGTVKAVSVGGTMIVVTSVADPSIQAYVYVTVASVEDNDLKGIVWDAEVKEYLAGFNTNTPEEWEKLHENPLTQDGLLCAVKVLDEDLNNGLYVTTFVNSQSASQLFRVEDDFTLTEIPAGDGLPPYDMAPTPLVNKAVISYDTKLYVINVWPDDEGHAAFSWGWSPATASGAIFCVANEPDFWLDEDYPEYGLCGIYYYIDENGDVYGLLIAPDYGASSPQLLAESGIVPTIYDSMYAVGSEDGETTYLYWTHYNEDLNASEVIIIDAWNGAVMQSGKNFGEGVWPVSGLYRDSDLEGVEPVPAAESAKIARIRKQFTINTPAVEGLVSRNENAKVEIVKQPAREIDVVGGTNRIRGKYEVTDHGTEGTRGPSAETGVAILTLSEDEKVANGFVTVSYDPEALEFVSIDVAVNQFKSVKVDKEKGKIKFAYAVEAPIPAEETLATLKFRSIGYTSEITVTTTERNDKVNLNEVETFSVAGEQKAAVVVLDPNDVQYNGTTPYVIYNGKAQKPKFVVKDEFGSVIPATEYVAEYKENTAAGTGWIIVTFPGKKYVDTKCFFKIYLPATTKTSVENVENGIKISWAKVEGAAGYVVYRRAWSSTTNGWTTFERWNNTTGTSWVDTKTYAGTRYQYGVKAYFARRTDPVSGQEIGGNVGDNFNLGVVGPLKTTVRITSRTLKSVTPGSKKLTVKWNGSKVFTGYHLQYATDAAFTKNVKTITIGDPATYAKVISGLTSGTTYYVRVRSYHVFQGMTYYGGWSASMSCKVK
ncbi:MAG: S8 family serine peptidase [Clostridia bacterium]|nr:S8 family serine peptidase [Clostridia bacterium]